MKTDNQFKSNLSEENICIPGDLILEVLGIIVKEQLKHEITQISENKSLIYVSVYINRTETRQIKLMQNIQHILNEYKEFRWEESEQYNWRES